MIVRSIKRTTARSASNGFASIGNARDRPMSTVPLHLSRANNGMVNVLVKSTKVPRPATIVPLKRIKKSETKLTPPVKEAMPTHISYVGNSEMPITSSLKIVTPQDDTPRGIWPVFRMMVSYYLQFDLTCIRILVLNIFMYLSRMRMVHFEVNLFRHQSSQMNYQVKEI